MSAVIQFAAEPSIDTIRAWERDIALRGVDAALADVRPGALICEGYVPHFHDAISIHEDLIRYDAPDHGHAIIPSLGLIVAWCEWNPDVTVRAVDLEDLAWLTRWEYAYN